MKHAALIMAHKNKEQLIRLVNAISCENIDIFIHLDKKWKLSQKEIDEIKNCSKNVFVIKKRIHGELDNWSLPQISLNLIDAVLKKEKDFGYTYSYFMLLSGQDYPIKSKQYICGFLEEQYPKPLIDYELAQDENWVYYKYQLTKYENKITDIQKKRKKGIIRTFLVGRCLLLYKLEKLFRGIPWNNLQKKGFKIYGGSQWWILPHGVIDYIKEQQRHNRKVIKELKRAWTPEENFFQTLAMNSPFIKYVVENDPIFNIGVGNFKAMTYCNFITPTKGFRGHPHIICAEDYDRIISKKALFARKFDINIDKEILDKIDKYIR